MTRRVGHDRAFGFDDTVVTGGDVWVKTGRWGNALRRQAARDESSPMVPNIAPLTNLTPGSTDTVKTRKEFANETAIGGMRNPAVSVGRVPGLRGTGAKVRQAIEKYTDEHPDILRDIVASAGAKRDGVSEDRIEDLAGHVARALGADHHRRGRRSMWRPGIVRAFVSMANDPDTELATWLEDGAPTGVARDIHGLGVFPATEAGGEAHAEIWRHWARLEPRSNYASVEEHHRLVRAEIQRLKECGFVSVYPNWDAVKKRFGQVVVSKMAAIVKNKEDGTVKLRLIIDMRRSQVNAHVRLHERIVLPRVVDMLRDALALQGRSSDDSELDMIVLDWADAFHSIGVHPDEFPHQVVKGFDGQYIGYETVLFGGAGSPGVWGRAAAFLGRSGQSLFSAEEARIQVYVDDPWTIWKGGDEERAKNLGLLLLWWRVLGPPISWRKVQVGRDVRWIGIHISIARGGVDLTIDPDFLSDLILDIQKAHDGDDILATDLRKIAGKAEWAAGLIPYLKPMVSPLWAAIADAPQEIIAKGRVAHALRWLVALFRRKRGTLTRHFRHDDQRAEGRLTIDVDASPWGFGGALYEDGRLTRYFGEAISDSDRARFDIIIGDPKDQALLETMALLIAIRLWLPQVRGQLWTVKVRSDSTAALGAAVRLRSRDPRMNAVIRELALDLAECRYELEFVEHIAGVSNVVADFLSRLLQPGSCTSWPAELSGAVRDHPGERDAQWWETAQHPGHGSACEGLRKEG